MPQTLAIPNPVDQALSCLGFVEVSPRRRVVHLQVQLDEGRNVGYFLRIKAQALQDRRRLLCPDRRVIQA